MCRPTGWPNPSWASPCWAHHYWGRARRDSAKNISALHYINPILILYGLIGPVHQAQPILIALYVSYTEWTSVKLLRHNIGVRKIMWEQHAAEEEDESILHILTEAIFMVKLHLWNCQPSNQAEILLTDLRYLVFQIQRTVGTIISFLFLECEIFFVFYYKTSILKYFYMHLIETLTLLFCCAWLRVWDTFLLKFYFF